MTQEKGTLLNYVLNRIATKRALIALVSLGILVRVVLWLVSRGSNDSGIWEGHARGIHERGLTWLYGQSRSSNATNFNHPPLMGYWAEAALVVAKALDLRFAIVMKIPGLVGEAGSLYVLWKLWKERGGADLGLSALVLYSWSLVSILVGSYHCNTDALCAFLCLLSAYLAESKGKYFWSGVALAAALNVKVVPVFLVPAALVLCQRRRDLVHFSLGLMLAIVPVAPVLVTSPNAFIRSVVQYSPRIENWGIPYVIDSSVGNALLGPPMRALLPIYMGTAKVLILALPFAAALYARFWRRLDLYEVYALSFACFLILAPGFGVQYTIFLCPVLFAVNLRWGTYYTALAGLFIGLVYLLWWDGTFPMVSVFRSRFPMPAPFFGAIAWAFTMGLVWRILNASWKRRRPCYQPE